jgi:hypothetical protein
MSGVVGINYIIHKLGPRPVLMEWREALNQGKDSADKRILKVKHSSQANLPVQPLCTNQDPLRCRQAPQHHSTSRPYVTHMAFLTQSDRFVAAFSSPSDSIATFSSPAGNAVQDGPSINEHPGGITGLKTDPISPFMLWSSGVDGFVKGFDLRTSRGGPSATLAGEPISDGENGDLNM